MIQRTLLLPLALACSAAASVATAQSLCSSDHVPQPQAVVERFVNADCEACWRDPSTPKAKPGELVLDWIVPGARGDDAPLAVASSADALDRLRELGRAAPARTDVVRNRVVPGGTKLRVAHGEPFNDYIGASIAAEPARGASLRAWLLLVEELPAGAEGSPVPRLLVRNAFRPDWAVRPPRSQRAEEMRAMQIHEGTKPSRLRVVGLLEDSKGRLLAATRSRCAAN